MSTHSWRDALEIYTSPASIALLLLGFAAGTRRAMQTSASFDSDPGNDPQR